MFNVSTPLIQAAILEQRRLKYPFKKKEVKEITRKLHTKAIFDVVNGYNMAYRPIWNAEQV